MSPLDSESDADLFLKYNYTETKDFCKQFLTLVVTVLVFSLTFSEKVVDFANRSFPVQISLAAAWIVMLLAIVMCGIGLTYMAMAGGDAVYSGNRFHALARRAYKLIVAAGGCFVVGLVLLIAVAVVAVRPASAPTTQDSPPTDAAPPGAKPAQ